MPVVRVTLLGEIAISTELEGASIAARLTPGGRVVLAGDLYREMQTDIVAQVLRRLAAIRI